MEEEYTERMLRFFPHRDAPVTKGDFLDQLWSLREVGNAESAYLDVCLLIRDERKTFKGETLTLELIVERYAAYLQFCKRQEYGEKYIRSIPKWLSESGYNEEYKEDLGNLKKFRI